MVIRDHNRHAPVLLAALLSVALPAGAQDGGVADSTSPARLDSHPNGEITLHLAETPAAATVRLELGGVGAGEGKSPLPIVSSSPDSAPTPTRVAAGLREPAWEAWRTYQQAQAMQSQTAPKRKGFGRWLKRHWYVAVLAAGAVALALQDDTPDSDD